MSEPSVAPVQPNRGATMQPVCRNSSVGLMDWIFFICPVRVNNQQSVEHRCLMQEYNYLLVSLLKIRVGNQK